MQPAGYFKKTLLVFKQWRGLLNLKSLFVVAAIDIMHRWPGRHPVRRCIRLFCRHRRFKLTLKGKWHYKIVGRYADYADYHAVCELFLDQVYDLYLLALPPNVVIDAGGHIGTFSLLAKAAFPEASILTFEPDSQNFTLLKDNIQRNNLKIETTNVALADFDGSTFLQGPSSMGRHIGAANGTKTQVRRLSQLVHFEPGSRLLIKIDVEGAEWLVLKDCAECLPKDTFIFIETHGGDEDLKKLEKFCAQWGFQHKHVNAKGEYHESILSRGAFSRS
jgi:FkbM family methyltransferase